MADWVLEGCPSDARARNDAITCAGKQVLLTGEDAPGLKTAWGGIGALGNPCRHRRHRRACETLSQPVSYDPVLRPQEIRRDFKLSDGRIGLSGPISESLKDFIGNHAMAVD